MHRYRHLAGPAYIVGLSFALLPLADALVDVMPMRASNPVWRFGAVGTLTGSLLSIVAGLLIILVVSVALEHDRVLRALTLFCGLGVLALIPVIAVFPLDALQARAGAQAELRGSVMNASLVALLKLIIAAIALVSIVIATRRSLRHIAEARRIHRRSDIAVSGTRNS